MMAEGHESGDPGRGPGGPERRSETDLLAERRARRAAESGEVILTRRAEAAEATVQTLERHVATLQERLLDAEEDLRRTNELLEIEKAAALEREHELRRVKQREYAEQQLRVEAEDRLTHVSDRESRAESERLARRLSASEQDARDLSERLERLQRQLAEAEQAAAAERAAVRRAEDDLQTRLGELEGRAGQMQQGLAQEREARERSEALLESMRQGHSRMEGLVGEMKGIVDRLSSAVAAEATSTVTPTPSGAEMADALAAAVERLRARAEAVPPEAMGEPAAESVVGSAPHAEAAAPDDRAPDLTATPPPPVIRPTHKHSLSLIGRVRLRRKQRRSR
ncbi:MAG: hypothetical protein ACYDHN_05845 [Solirubrobacteraceae bacterium]